jgi:HTH-type transcriptional regulator/antitoxin HigA
MTATAKPRATRPKARQLFNRRKYSQLLVRAVPTVIHTDGECKRATADIGKLLRKGGDLSSEEERLLDLLSVLVERYEDEAEDFPDSPPDRILRFLMEQNDLRQADLVKIFGSRGRVSEVVNGKRAISKAQSKALGEYFRVSPELFI